MKTRQLTVGGVVALVAALLFALFQGGDGGRDTSVQVLTTTSPTVSLTASPDPGGVDPESGLRWVAVSDLPEEAHETLELIDSGGPYPYEKDGSTFFNYEGILPTQPEGYYKEYTVDTPGSEDRGPRRIVTGAGGEYFWTSDHYASFARIER